MAVVVGTAGVAIAAASPSESSSNGEARRKLTGWEDLPPSSGPEWPIPLPNSREPSHFRRTDPTFENGLLVISQSFMANSAPLYILPQTSVAEYLRCAMAATIGFGMPGNMESHWPKLRIVHEATGKQYKVLPPYLYTVPIGKDKTPLKCKGCNDHDMGSECFIFAYTGPSSNGKYPRMNSEGDPEEIMMYSCYQCVVAGRRCEFLGVVIWGDRAMLKKPVKGYAAEEEDKFLRQPPLEKLITLPGMCSMNTPNSNGRVANGQRGFRFDMPPPKHRAVQAKHNTRPPQPVRSDLQNIAGPSRSSTPTSRSTSETPADLAARLHRSSPPTFHASRRPPPSMPKRPREGALSVLVPDAPPLKKRPRPSAPGSSTTPVTATGRVAQSTTPGDGRTTRTVLPPTPQTSSRVSPPRSVAVSSAVPPTPRSDTESEHSDMLLVLAEEAERDSSPVVSDRRPPVTHETSFARRSPESLTSQLRGESEESDDDDDDWSDDDAGSVVGPGSAPKPRQNAPAPGPSTSSGNRVCRGRSVSSAAARALSAQTLQPGWREAGIREILDYGNTTFETLSDQLSTSRARVSSLDVQLRDKMAEIAKLQQNATQAGEAQTKLEGDLAVKTEEHNSALMAILQLNNKLKAHEERSTQLVRDVEGQKAEVTRLKELVKCRDDSVRVNEKDIEELKRAAAARDTELEAAKKTAELRDAKISSLESERTKSSAKVAEQARALRTAAAQAEADAKKIEALERRAKERDAQIAALNDAARMRDQQLDILRKANSRHVMSIWRVGDEMATLRAQMDAAAAKSKSTLSGRDATITSLRADAASRHLVIEGAMNKQTELRKLLSESRDETKLARDRVSELKLELQAHVLQLEARQSTIDGLSVQVQERDRTISDLRAEVDKVKADTKVELGKERSKLAAELQKVRGEADAAKSKMVVLEKEVEQGRKALQGAEKAIEALQDKLVAAKRSEREAEVQANAHAHEVKRLEAALKKGREALESAQTAHAARENKLTADLESANSSIKTQVDEVAALKKASVESGAAAKRLKEELDSAQTRARTVEARVKEMEGDLSVARARVEVLCEAGKKQSQSHEALRSELAAREKDLASSKSDAEALRAEKAALEKDAASARQAATDAEVVSRGLRADIEAQDSAVAVLKGQISTLEKDKAGATSRIDELEVELATASNTVERLTSEAKEKDAAIVRRDEAIETARTDALRMTTEVAEARKEVAKRESDLVAARNEVTRLHGVETALRDTLSTCNAALAAAQRKEEQLTAETEGLGKTIAERDAALETAAQNETRLTEEVAGLSARVTELGSAVTAAQQDVARLEGEKKDVQVQLEQRGGELEAVRKEMAAAKQREATLVQQLSDRTTEHAQAVRERDEAQTDLTSARVEAGKVGDAHAAVVADLKEKMRLAVAERQHVETERAALQKRCDEAISALERADTAHAETKRKLEEVQHSAADAAAAATAELTAVEAERDALSVKLSQAEVAARTATEQHTAAVRRLEDAARMRETESADSIKRALDAQLQAEQSLARAQAAAVEAAQAHANAMSEARAAHSAAVRRLDDAARTQEVESADSIKRALDAQLQAERSLAREQAAATKAAQAHANALSEARAAHFAAAKKAADELQAARTEAADSRKKVERKREELREAQGRITTMVSETEQSKSRVDQAAKAAQTALDAAMKGRRKAEEHLSKARNSHAAALDELRRRMQDAEQACSDRDVELKELSDRVSASDAEIVALNAGAMRAEEARAQLQSELDEERLRCERLVKEAEEHGALVDTQLDYSDQLLKHNEELRAMLEGERRKGGRMSK